MRAEKLTHRLREKLRYKHGDTDARRRAVAVTLLAYMNRRKPPTASEVVKRD